MLVATIFYGAYFRFLQFHSTTFFRTLMENLSSGNKGVWVWRVKRSWKSNNSLSFGVKFRHNILLNVRGTNPQNFDGAAIQ